MQLMFVIQLTKPGHYVISCDNDRKIDGINCFETYKDALKGLKHKSDFRTFEFITATRPKPSYANRSQ